MLPPRCCGPPFTPAPKPRSAWRRCPRRCPTAARGAGPRRGCNYRPDDCATRPRDAAEPPRVHHHGRGSPLPLPLPRRRQRRDRQSGRANQQQREPQDEGVPGRHFAQGLPCSPVLSFVFCSAPCAGELPSQAPTTRPALDQRHRSRPGGAACRRQRGGADAATMRKPLRGQSLTRAKSRSRHPDATGVAFVNLSDTVRRTATAVPRGVVPAGLGRALCVRRDGRRRAQRGAVGVPSMMSEGDAPLADRLRDRIGRVCDRAASPPSRDARPWHSLASTRLQGDLPAVLGARARGRDGVRHRRRLVSARFRSCPAVALPAGRDRDTSQRVVDPLKARGGVRQLLTPESRRSAATRRPEASRDAPRDARLGTPRDASGRLGTPSRDATSLRSLLFWCSIFVFRFWPGPPAVGLLLARLPCLVCSCSPPLHLFRRHTHFPFPSSFPSSGPAHPLTALFPQSLLPPPSLLPLLPRPLHLPLLLLTSHSRRPDCTPTGGALPAGQGRRARPCQRPGPRGRTRGPTGASCGNDNSIWPLTLFPRAQ